VNFLKNLSRPEKMLLNDLVGGEGFVPFIETTSISKKDKVDLLRRKLGLPSTDEQNSEDEARKRRVKMKLHLERVAREEADDKMVNQMFDYDAFPNGDIAREVANKALEGEGMVCGGMYG
jgi:hypothetical protein